MITGNNSEPSFRNAGNELAFSNILQLSNLRSRLSSLQNNVINELMIPVPMLQRNREVSFLHHVIEPDSDESNENEDDLVFNELSDEGIMEADGSSMGSFVFGQLPIALDESD